MIKTKETEKALALVKGQTSKAIAAAQALIVKDEKSLEKAAELILKINAVGKLIKKSMAKFIDPAKEIIKNTKEMFGPVEKRYQEAEGIVTSKMIDFREKEAAKAKIKEAKIAEKVESGKISFEKASEKIEKIVPKKAIGNKAGKVQFRIHKTIEIVDEKKIPRSYYKLDLVRIRADALNGIEIPGVKVVEKEILAKSSY